MYLEIFCNISTLNTNECVHKHNIICKYITILCEIYHNIMWNTSNTVFIHLEHTMDIMKSFNRWRFWLQISIWWLHWRFHFQWSFLCMSKQLFICLFCVRLIAPSVVLPGISLFLRHNLKWFKKDIEHVQNVTL